MTIKTVDVGEAQTHLSELLSLAQQGDEVIITDGDVPLARLVAIASRTQPRIAGLHRGAMQIRDDFNEPLPDDFWTGAA